MSTFDAIASAVVKLVSGLLSAKDARERAQAWRRVEATAGHQAAIEESRALHAQERKRRGR